MNRRRDTIAMLACYGLALALIFAPVIAAYVRGWRPL
jgi:hypothetical protein